MDPLIQIIFIAAMTYIIGTMGFWLSRVRRWLLFGPSILCFFGPFPFIVWVFSHPHMSEQTQQLYVQISTSLIVAGMASIVLCTVLYNRSKGKG